MNFSGTHFCGSFHTFLRFFCFTGEESPELRKKKRSGCLIDGKKAFTMLSSSSVAPLRFSMSIVVVRSTEWLFAPGRLRRPAQAPDRHCGRNSRAGRCVRQSAWRESRRLSRRRGARRHRPRRQRERFGGQRCRDSVQAARAHSRTETPSSRQYEKQCGTSETSFRKLKDLGALLCASIAGARAKEHVFPPAPEE